MKLVTAEQMRHLDTAASQEYGISSLILMENAGRAVADKTAAFMEGSVVGKRIVIFSGKGNNGGDGFVVARHLANRGADVKVFLLNPREEIAGDALINLQILEKLGISISIIGPRDVQRVKVSLLYSDVIIDAIFGTGFRGKATGKAAWVIEAINDCSKPVIAVDLPSGLEADTGKVEGPCIRASLTCTLGLPKLGFYLYPGAEFCGEIAVMDISLPGPLMEKDTLCFNLIEKNTFRGLFSPRPRDSHKGTYGRVYTVGGSTGLTGAVALAAEAALRSGAGLVTACVPASFSQVMESKLTEAMTFPLPESEHRVLGPDAAGAIVKKAGAGSVIAVGPGLSTHPGTEGFISELIKKSQSPLVIDADGLNSMAKNPDVLLNLQVPAVITPHPGEMARLLGVSVKDVQNDRIGAASNFALRYGVVVVLKGANTIVAEPGGQMYVNSTGNPGMATAGAGDVLTGIIASFLAQGFTPVTAAVAGTYIHGAAADSLAREMGERGITSGEILKQLPNEIAKLEKSN